MSDPICQDEFGTDRRTLKLKEALGPEGIYTDMRKHKENYAKKTLQQLCNESWKPVPVTDRSFPQEEKI